MKLLPLRPLIKLWLDYYYRWKIKHSLPQSPFLGEYLLKQAALKDR